MRYHLINGVWVENDNECMVVPKLDERGNDPSFISTTVEIAPCIDISVLGAITHVRVIIDVGGKRWCRHTLFDNLVLDLSKTPLLDKDNLLMMAMKELQLHG